MSSGHPGARSGHGVPRGLYPFVALLSVGTGSLDVVAFLALGDAFASVMTGNLVLLGLALGTWSPEWAIFTGAAVVGYVVGGYLGSAVMQWGDPPQLDAPWPVRLVSLLVLELALLTVLALAWARMADDPTLGGRLALLGAGATAMGAQSAAVRAIPVRVSTTYLTGAVTSVVEAVATRRPFSVAERAAVVALLSLVGGAALGALLLDRAPEAGLALPPAGLLLAIAVVIGQRRRSRDV